jgi:16S rRNA (cytosine1402-N4)-methyltransferase
VRAASAAMARGDEPLMATDGTDIGSVGAAHVPVLEGLVVGGLRPRPGARLVDATIGLGGHARALLAAAPDTVLLGLDRDPAALAHTRARLAECGERLILREGSFADLRTHLDSVGWDAADGVLVDLGVSSMQLADAARGFSFRAAGPLDMRMGPGAAHTAGEVVNTFDERALAQALREYGEEPRARAIARAIVRARPLETTTDLATVVARVVGRAKPGHHPATRTFQAIRILVNDELGALDALLTDGWQWLRPGGRLAILAYHSLEDRRVKTAFRRWAADCICPPYVPRCVCGWRAKVRLVTTKALRPDAEEIARNPRARSARLRIVERLDAEAR